MPATDWAAISAISIGSVFGCRYGLHRLGVDSTVAFLIGLFAGVPGAALYGYFRWFRETP